jgi:hypothetical protein
MKHLFDSFHNNDSTVNSKSDLLTLLLTNFTDTFIVLHALLDASQLLPEIRSTINKYRTTINFAACLFNASKNTLFWAARRLSNIASIVNAGPYLL